MLDLKTKNHTELTSDVNSTKLSLYNSLDVNNCLFTPELLTYILKSNKYQSPHFKDANNKHAKIIKDKEGIYLIFFRILNKEKRSLVYNYIYYNDMLYLTLIVYFLVRNYFITENDHEWGKYLVILDNIFLTYDFVNKYFYLYNKDKARN